MLKNNIMQIKPFSKLEMIVVGLTMAAILMPARLVAMYLFHDSVLANVVILSSVTGFFIIGSKQGWLGKFGDMFINTILRIQKGKRKFIFITEMVFVVTLMGGSAFLIHEGNTTYGYLKEHVKAQLADMDIETQEDLMEISSQTTPEQQAEAIVQMPRMLVEEFATVAVTQAIVNDMMGGWYMHFATVIVIENIQIVGFLIIARKFLKERAEKAQS